MWGSAPISTVQEWRRCLGPVGKKPALLFFVGEGGGGAEVVRWGQAPQPAGNTCLLPGRPGGAHSPLVIGFGPDPALPPDASRTQGYHRRTGQCRKDLHSLPVVRDSRMGGGAGPSHQTDKHFDQSPEPFPASSGSPVARRIDWRNLV